MPYGLPDILELITHPEEYIQDYPLYQWYKGIVEDNDDPEKLGRVKVRVEEVWKSSAKTEEDITTPISTESLPWADVLFPIQGSKRGAFIVPEKGTAVIVVFEKGIEDNPMVVGGWWGTDEVPLAALGEDQTGETANDKKGNDTGVTTADGGTIEEPTNPYNTTYPKNTVFRTSTGHLIELDDTAGAERINIAHKSGSWAEFHPDGTLVFGVQGKRYTVVEGDDGEHIKGKQDVVVDGNATKRAAGTMTHKSDDDYSISSNSKVLIDASQTLEQSAGAGIKQESAEFTFQGPSGAPATSVDILATTTTISTAGTGYPVVTTSTHPLDYITGIPINGLSNVLAGP